MLLRAEHITCRFGNFVAVDDVTLSIAAGQSIGLVGESGCGKTTLARTLVGLHAPHAGQVYFHEQPLNRRHLSGALQMVFQDPASSLNPRLTVLENVAMPLRGSDKTRAQFALSRVELPDSFWRQYPNTLSIGQQQRVAIARALVAHPEFIVCDEPVSALDMSARADIINLLQKLRNEDGAAMLVISHDLRMVRHLCDQVAVMEAGHFVEFGENEQIFQSPKHDFTKRLLAAIPRIPSREDPLGS